MHHQGKSYPLIILGEWIPIAPSGPRDHPILEDTLGFLMTKEIQILPSFHHFVKLDAISFILSIQLILLVKGVVIACIDMMWEVVTTTWQR
jgi:hypothetical protein